MNTHPEIQFVTLDRFVGTFEDDIVSGRSTGLSGELKDRVRRFANGKMPEDECGNFIVEIVWNESAMSFLAELLGD